jgi:N-acetylglucosaminyldiphosphoundecaprenol N-acetyl-beta-D-mannosaminyltransferase
MSREEAARVRIGTIEVDRLTFDGALDAIEELVRRRQGGAVFTPNVDHVVLADEDLEFRNAYEGASLRLADGMPLLWASRALGQRLPEKISGSDLVGPLLARAARKGWRVYLLGAGPGVAAQAAAILRDRPGVNIVGVDAPVLSDPRSAAERAPIVAKLLATAPDLVLVAFGAPKQELFIHAARTDLGSAVALGVGASLDFIAGNVQRAPRWMSEHGLEWLYRLIKEPRRMWRRYLLRDPKFLLILFRSYRELRAQKQAA